uniref:Putative conserved plasma membrane protein n=1 Tax=Hyalomma excavatum TaxID=257692 RepID=A0A131X7X2_9ACAR
MSSTLGLLWKIEVSSHRLPRLLYLRQIPLQRTSRLLPYLQWRNSYIKHSTLGGGVTSERPSYLIPTSTSNYCTKSDFKRDSSPLETSDDQKNEEVVEEKLNIFQRYKKMFKEYWYVMLPVHIATSIVWFGSFFYLATCGVDVVPIMEYLGLPESIISPLRKSGLNYIATASAMYKLATPARYAVTLGGTSIAIRILVKRGLIKPMPSGGQLRQLLRDKMKPQ